MRLSGAPLKSGAGGAWVYESLFLEPLGWLVRLPLPPKDNLHLPVLKVLNDAGGSLGSHDALEQVKSYYPQLTPDELASRLDSGENRLNNRIRWSRFDLVLSGDVERGTGGTWKITAKGVERLKQELQSWKPEYTKSPAGSSSFQTQTQTQTITQALGGGDPLEVLEQARRELVRRVEDEVLERLRTVEPSEFEHIIAELLEKLEYGSIADGTIRVTGRSHDGGIDGVCAMDRLGMYKALFQAKRWTKQVDPGEVRDFIGALHNKRVEQGIFVTTSDFSQQARDEARQSGNVKLIDGKELAKIMVEAGLGVRKTSIDLPRIDEDYFSGLV